jgi:hypothetical protein
MIKGLIDVLGSVAWICKQVGTGNSSDECVKHSFGLKYCSKRVATLKETDSKAL